MKPLLKKSSRPASRASLGQRKLDQLVKQILAGKVSIHAATLIKDAELRLPHRRLVE